jgi:membrane protein DedA with SNARE-associated domain
MDQLAELLNQYGYVLLFVVGFLEYAGAPIASVPVLIVAGALSAAGGPPVPGIVLAVALGGLAGDLLWYGIARRRGQGVIDLVCGLSSNPTACIFAVQERLNRVGAGFLLPAKLLPGVGNLVAAAAGFARLRLRTFVLMDGVGLLAWATVYSMLGWLFSAQVEAVVESATGFTVWIAMTAAALIVGAGAWRVAKVRMHRAGHAAMRVAQSGSAGAVEHSAERERVGS